MNNLNKFSRAILAIAMMLCVAFISLAHDFEVDGIYYNYLDKIAKTVAVTYKGNSYNSYANEYSSSVSIPSSVTYNGTSYSVTSIGEDAFWDCSGLTSVTIPNSVTSIGSRAFLNCSGLTEVNITDLSAWCKIVFEFSGANPLSYAKKLKLNGNEIKDLVIPNDITEIKNYAFESSDLTTVTIPNSVTSIGDYVFRWCTSLTSVTIPNSVTSIGKEVFNYCWDLETIISLNPTPPTCASSGTFYSSNYTNSTLYVPKDSYAKYFINDEWGKFKNIKKIETLVSSIKLNNTSIELDKGSTATLTATITPSNATIKNVVWESSNPQVAKVDQSGIVTALSAGTATITATAVDGSEVSTSCKVVVKGVDTKITLSQTEAIMLVNDIITLTYSVTPSIVSVEWSTSNSNVVYIKKNSDNSVAVVGMADGEAIVTARATDGSGTSASCKVVVSSDPKITLSQSEAKLEIDDIIILSYTITGTPIQTASWSTSDASVAKIKANSNGTIAVTGIADGIAIITATLVYPSGVEFSASCEVTVGVGGVEGVETDENSIEVSRYDIHGRLLSEPTKGINIIKMSDGTTRKEIVK